jgi:Right handed beta helix region
LVAYFKNSLQNEEIKMKLILILCISTISALSVVAVPHYVNSADGEGSDSFDGLFPEHITGTLNGPWETIAKANSHEFDPGDQILFRRGETFVGEYRNFSDGAAGNHIVIGAYGGFDTDPNPILTSITTVFDSNNPTKWSSYQVNSGIWFMNNVLKDPTRLWLNGTEYVEANAAVANPVLLINDQYRWYYDSANDRLYVYTGNETKPSSVYSSGIVGLQDYQHVLNFGKDCYITIQNLTILGGSNGAICIMRDSHDFIIENCIIGKSCKGLLLQGVDNNSLHDKIYNITIRNNTICVFGNPGSTETLEYDYEYKNLSDGIYLWAAEDVEIHDNKFYDWGHADIQLSDDHYGLERVYIHHNKFYGGRVDYSRGICYNGREPDKVDDIAFYANEIKDKTVRNQINGEQMLFYDNLIERMSQSPAQSANRGSAQGLNIYAVNDWPNASNNIVAFNTIKDCPEPGFSIWNMTSGEDSNFLENNWIVNNTIINCGTLIGGSGNYGYLEDLSIDIEETNAYTIMNNHLLNNDFDVEQDLDSSVHYKDANYKTAEFNELDGDDGNIINGNVNIYIPSTN